MTTGQPRESPLARRAGISIGNDGKTYVLGEVSNGHRYLLHGTMRLILWVEPGEELYEEIGAALNG